MNPVSRRSFLATAAAAGLGSLLAKAQATETASTTAGPAPVAAPRPWQPYSDRKVRVGLVGHGYCQFGVQFSLQHHPNVEIVAVSDLFPDRRAEMARLTRCGKTYASLEEMVQDPKIEAIFCATDAPSHARHAMLCLEHGKHVATAVPAFWGNAEEGERLLECCRRNRGLVYAMFETSCYHDDLYAMEKLYAAGVFGRLIYSEGDNCDPRPKGAPALPSYRDWRQHGCPMWYSTHATAYYVGVTHQPFVAVTCWGTGPLDGQPAAANAIGNTFNSEIGLFRTAEGGVCRITATKSQGEYLEAGRIRGEYGGFAGTFKGDRTGTRRYYDALKGGLDLKKPALPPGVEPGGHGGSHGYLGDDFIAAILGQRAPRVGIIDALNMTMPGYIAHLSAMKDGETLKIPQFAL